MDNLDDLLRGLREGEDSSEDKTLFIRETSKGPKVDFEIIERTSFEKAYPETVKELRSKEPLGCSHLISKENPFGGYCGGKKFLFFLRRKTCGKEYCARCAVQCSCGIFVSANCCVRQFEGILYCKKCWRRLRTIKAIKTFFNILLHPFVSQDLSDDR